MRKLSREYGWSAVGIYFLLSALDFPFCFVAVGWLGTERIGRLEHAIIEWVKRAIPFQIPEAWGGKGRLSQKAEQAIEGTGFEQGVEELKTGYDHGVKEAEIMNSREDASKLELSHFCT